MTRVLILVFNILLVTTVNGQKKPFGREYFSRSECVQDIQQLQKVLNSYHPDLNRYTSKEELKIKFDKYIYQLSDSINSFEFYTDLTLLLNQVRDGHLYLGTSPKMNVFEVDKGHLLPFTFRILDYKLFVNENFGSTSIEKWDLITSIEGIPTTELIYEILPLVPTDGYCTGRKVKLLEQHFSLLYARKYGFKNSYQVKLLRKGKLSRKEDVLVNSVKTPQFFEKKNKQKDQLIFELDKGKGVAYLKVPSFNSFEIERSGVVWKKWLKEHFKEVREDSINNVILDIRTNQGGDVGVMTELLEYLSDRPFQLYDKITVNKGLLDDPLDVFSPNEMKTLKKKINLKNDSLFWDQRFVNERYEPNKYVFLGNLYVLIGGETYSSASHAVQLLRNREKVKVYGDEAGGNGVGSNAGKSLKVVLKNSQYKLTLPLMQGNYKTGKVYSETSGILPDQYCGNDVLMELKYSDICLLSILEEIQSKKRINNDGY